jgi:hypothetical protein
MDPAVARDIGPGPSGRIPAIIRELEKATVEIARLVEEEEHQAKIERQRWDAQREQWHVEGPEGAQKELLQVIEAGRRRSESRSSSPTPNAERTIYRTRNGNAQ